MSVPILTAEIIDTWHARQRRQERFAHPAIVNLVALRNKLHASKFVSGIVNKILINNTIEFPAPADCETFAQFSLNCWAHGPLLSRRYFGYPLPLMTSTIATEVSPDSIGFRFRFSPPLHADKPSIAPVVGWSRKSVPKNASARCRCGANSAVAIMTIIREASIYGGI